MLENYHIIAFTHRNLDLNDIGKLHIDETKQAQRLRVLSDTVGLDELMFLSTCNRVEFHFLTPREADSDFALDFFRTLYPEMSSEQIEHYAHRGDQFKGIGAVEHILSVASSIDSMVVGEREIITQVRNAFEASRNMGLTGDFIRVLMRHTIETAKRVYTETSIAIKPVSVVSLAYHKLRDMNIPLDARVMIIGAGVTNTNMSRFLKKHGFKHFAVFNRTLSKAESLAQDLQGNAYPLNDLSDFRKGFDVLITCTGSEHHIVTPEIYASLLNGETDRKVIIDLALPQDIDPEIVATRKVTHISVEVLQKISNENLKERSKEIQRVEEIIAEALFEFRNIHKLRSVELAMREVPQKVKEIRSNAVNEIYKDEINRLDPHSREVLEKVIGYMEKKYMSVPMIMAKEILLKH